MIIKVPGKKQVASTAEIVEYVDIYPTLCELTGLELPEHLQGDAFTDLLFDENARSDGVAVCQWFKGITTIKDSYFYTEWVDDQDQAFARMLYDHSSDPEENIDVSGEAEHAALIENLSAEMRRSRAEEYFREVPLYKKQ